MDREELKEKISDLNNLAEKVKSNYRDFYMDVSFSEYRRFHEDTGQGVSDRRVKNPGEQEKMSAAVNLYEEWYSSSEVLVKNYYPSRLEEFRNTASKVRKLITLSTEPLPLDQKELVVETDSAFNRQIGIVNSLINRKDISEMKFRKQVKENLALEEVERAQRLFEDDLPRPAGVLAGVALERHLKTIMDEREETDSDFDVDIGEAANELYDEGIISNTKKKEIINYGGVRNDCAHSDDEIEEIQVEKMINSVEDFIRRR